MQERWQILVDLFQASLAHEGDRFLYVHARLLHAVALQLQYHSEVGKEALSILFQSLIKPLSEKFLWLSQQSDDEKIRRDFSNFLYQLHDLWELKRLAHTDLNLGSGYQHNLLEKWDSLSNSVAEDIGYLFGPAHSKGYQYGEMLQQEIASRKTDYTTVERIAALLNTALPIVNRRLSLLSEQEMACTEEELKQWTSMLDSLIQWRIAQGNLMPLEWKNLLRYAHATLLYQSRLLKPFNSLEAAQIDFNFMEQSEASSGLLKVQRMLAWLDRVNRDFPKQCILNENMLDHLLSLCQESSPATLPENYRDLKATLFENRKVFQKIDLSPFQQQQAYSETTRALMQTMLDNSTHLLGTPPCHIGLLLLGSSSRGDRCPYSDIELALLYEPLSPAQKLETDHYIAGLIALMELQIIHLGESGEAYQGVWLDSSTSIRCHAHLRGSPEVVFQKGIVAKQNDIGDWKYLPEEKNPRGLTLHSFLYDPSAYSLMQPLLVNQNYSGEALYQRYQVKLNAYLAAPPDEKLLGELCEIVHPYLKHPLKPTHFTNRQVMALWVWWDVLRCLPDHLNDFKDNQVDLKKVYHKPLAYFVLGLRLYYNLSAKNLEETLQQAHAKGYLSLPLANFLLTTLEWVIRLRIDYHHQTKQQIETLALNTLTAEGEWHLRYFPELFRILQGAVEYFLACQGEETPPVFEFHLRIKDYLEHKLIHLKTEAEYVQWFKDVTGYLFYTHDYLDVHRYYYRLIPEAYREASLKAAQAFFGGLKQQCPHVRYWNSEADFWEKLWEAPLPNGKRPSYLIQKTQWKKQLRSLLTKEEKKENVHITSLTLGKWDGAGQFQNTFNLKPAVAKWLLKSQWINEKGAFTKKDQHPIAKDMLGNHLVIPYPHKDHPQFYFKVYPEYPLVELCLNDLSRRLGYYPPRQVDVWLWQCGKYDYPVLVSEAVPGETLQEALEHDQHFTLNRQGFSQSVFTNLLLSLEDNKPDNIVVLGHEEKVRLCLVDADRWFVPAFKGGKLHAKDIVFCLPDMAQSADRVLREEVLSLNPEKLLKAWVSDMKQWGERCIAVFGGKIVDYYDNWRSLEEKSLLLPPLKFHAVNDVFDHLQAIQDVFAQNSKPYRPLTHWQLVASVNSRLANHYGLAAEQHSNPLARFEFVAGHAYSKGKPKSNTTRREYFSTKIDFKTQMTDLWEGLPDQFDIQKHWQKDMENAENQLAGLAESQAKLQEVLKQLKKNNLQRFLQLSQKGQSRLLAKLDWSTLSAPIQKELLKALTHQGHWQQLMVQQSSELTDERFEKLLQKSPQLRQLSLKDCVRLSEAFLGSLPQPDCTLTRLRLSHLPQLKYLGRQAGGIFTSEFCVSLPHLESLSLKQCANVLDIHIKAPLLKTLTVFFAPQLKRLRTQSEQLVSVHTEGLTALPLNEWRWVATKGYLLNHVQWKDDRVLELDRLIACVPLLLTFPWGDYSLELVKQYARYAAKAWGDYSKAYVALVPRKRAEWFNQTKSLLDTCQPDFDRIERRFIPPLLKALEDKDSNVRQAAKDSNVRQAAAGALGQLKIPSPAVIDALIKALGDNSFWNSYSVYKAAVGALVQLVQESPAVIGPLLQALGDKKWGVRKAAAEVLGQLKAATPAVIDALIQALGDQEWGVRQAAAVALGQLKVATLAVIDALIKVLGNNDWSVRQAAAGALVQLVQESPTVIDALLKALGDKDCDVRQATAVALVQLGQESPAVIDALLKALEDRNKNVRPAAAVALGQLKAATPAVIDALLKALGNKDKDVRQAAAVALGQLKGATPAAIDTLIKALENKDKDIRQAAAVALGQLKVATPAVIDTLIKALGDKESDVRPVATRALGQLKAATPAVINTLIKALGDDYNSVRLAAAGALVQLGQESPAVIDALIKALGNKDKDVRLNAARALGQIKVATPAVINALTKALGDKDKDVHPVAAVLVRLGQENPAVIDILIKAVGGKERKDVHPAAAALVQLGQENPAVIDTLIKAVGGKERYVRPAATEVLGQLKAATPAVIDVLLKALGDQDVSVRLAATRVLGQIKVATPAVIDALLKALEDRNKNVRPDAAVALGQLKVATPAVIDALTKTLGDQDYNFLRLAAAGALVQLGQESPAIIDVLLKALGDQDYNFLRLAAAGALGQLKIPSPAVIDALLKALGDQDKYSDIRLAAAGALGQLKIPSPAVIDALLKALGDQDKYSDIRLAAAGALGQLSQFLQKQIYQRLETYTQAWQTTLKAASVPLKESSEKPAKPLSVVKGVEGGSQPTTHSRQWGVFCEREIARYAFRFFDTRSLKSAGCVNRACHALQVEIESERQGLTKN